ncbi:aspartate dehydrogenase [Candidatus Omnitrophota bacterium]
MKKSAFLKIGIAGCGAIGSSLAKTIAKDFSKEARLCGFYDTLTKKAYQLAALHKNKKLALLSLEELISKSQLIIEATAAASSYEIAKKSLSARRDVMVMSVGGILDHYRELEALAKEKGAKLYIPSGAICGIDGLKAASCSKIKSVVLTTRKPPKGFLGLAYLLKKKINLEKIKEDTVIFEGPAFLAVKKLPKNINVAATLSIAGIGAEKTLVRIIACPGIKRNIHEIEIDSEAGRITARTENVIHPDNPKTSYLAVLSAVATLKQALQPMKVGN